MTDRENGRMALSRALGKNLRAARTEKGLSQEALGLVTGLQQSYIGRLERGEVVPGADKVACLAWGLQVPIGRLYGEAFAAEEAEG